jgi:sodium/bile acid cotransporter 7
MPAVLRRLRPDPFLVQLAAAVLLAALLPARGAAAEATTQLASVAVAMLFFLHGAKLAPKAVLDGLLHWRLQALVAGSTYLLFPALGLALTFALKPFLPPMLLLGLLFIGVLPSTVQSSIAFTAVARGNVPAALCAATLSNLVGMLLTPLLVALLMQTGGAGGFSLDLVRDIALHLLLPFALGQAARPLIGGFLGRNRLVVGLVDRGSILISVYSAFSEGMNAGIWRHVDLPTLALVVAANAALLAAVLGATRLISRRMGLGRADEVVAVFCGSKKSLASGIPMANILFPAASIGLIVLPLILFHQLQLFACAALARRYARAAEAEPRPAGTPALAAGPAPLPA